MSKENKYSRILLKRTNVVGLSATTAPTTDHTLLPAWSVSDIYVGEYFLNIEDEKLWIRTTNNIKEIPLLDGTSSLNSFPDVSISSPTDGQVLTYSGGTWVNRSPDVAGTGVTYSLSPFMMATSDSMLSSTPIATETIIKEIDNLTDVKDVSVNNLQNFDVLIRKDGKWMNMSSIKIPIKKSTINELVNVEINEPENDQFLVFKENKWINKTKLNKIESLSWDKSQSKLLLETDEGVHSLSIQGKPIHTIIEDVELDETFHTLIIDTSANDVNILLPPASLFYGNIFIFKVINYTYNTTILAADSEFIYTDSLLTEYTISEDISQQILRLQSDGNSTWYSI